MKGMRVLFATMIATTTLGCTGGFKPLELESITPAGTALSDVTPIVYATPIVEASNVPAALSNSRDQMIRFEVATDERLSVKSATCVLDTQAPQDCSTFAYAATGLTDGDHVLVIWAEDTNGQKTQEIRIAFRIDATAPTVTMSQMPPMISGATVMFAFAGADALSGLASIECALDAGSYATCTSPLTLNNLQSGNHTVKMRAKDMAGNLSAESITTWMVDTSTPVITLSTKPNAVTNVRTANFAFTGTIGSTPVSAYQCSIDGGAFAACTSPIGFMNLVDGMHTFRIQGRDNNGQFASPLAYTWLVDTVVPTTPVLTANVGANTKLNAASISFTATDVSSSISSYQCSLDNSTFAACTSPRALTALAEGQHSLRVKAFDGAGNESSIGTFSWRIDTTVPTVTFTSKPLTMTMDTTASYAFTAADAGSGVATVECQIDTQAFAACTSPRTLTGLTTGMHAFRVRATDLAGNAVTVEDKWTIEGAAPSPTPAPALDGRLLYSNHCASCHGPVDSSTKKGRTAAQISSAINSVGSMGSLKSLTTAQVSAIADAMNGIAPIVCNTTFTPVRSPLRLLSNNEYDNVAVDVFKSVRRPSVDAKFDVSAPGSSGFSNTHATSEANSTIITTMMAEKYFNAANAIADEVITNKAQAGSAYSTLASCAAATPVTETCFDSIVRSVTLKVWRRPVSESTTNNEFARLKTILKGGGAFDVGFRDFITALLISPNYLTLSYRPATSMAANMTFELNSYQLASRLSFFLWQSTPDDSLLAAAANDSLKQAATLQSQVLRMLKDVRARRITSAMTSEWIGVDKIRDMGLTTISAGTINSMLSETRLLFDDIVVNDQSFLKSISADYAYLDKAMADHYGIPFNGQVATSFYKHDLSMSPRRGVMGQAAFLVSTSGSQSEVHPVQRGKALAMQLGCYEIAPPPAGIDTSLMSSTFPATATPREKLAIHTQNASCASCHNILDPYGLAMETFDARGLWRNTYSSINRTIDTSGKLPSGETFANTMEFTTKIIASPSVRSCLVKKVMALGLARKVASTDDSCSANTISTTAMTETAKFSDLVLGIVNSRQFKMQSTEAP